MNVVVQTSIYYHPTHNQVFASEYIQHTSKDKVDEKPQKYDTHH